MSFLWILEISMRTWPVDKTRYVRAKSHCVVFVKIRREVKWWMKPSPRLLPEQVGTSPVALGTPAAS